MKEQRINLAPVTKAAQTPAGVSPATFLIQLPINASGKAKEDGPLAWSPATRVGDMNEAPGFWFLPGPAPALADI